MTSLLLVFVSGFVLRLVLLNQSFWLDEAASIEIASRPLVEFFRQMRFDFHPPLFYLLLKLWLPFSGRSEWLIRLPFVFISSLSIIAIYLLAKQFTSAKDSRIPLVAAIFLAVNPLHIYYSQELRMYGINALFTILSWHFLLKNNRQENTKDSTLFIVFSTLNLYTFYGAILNLIAQAVFVLYSRPKTKFFVFHLPIIIILFLPLLPTFTSQLQNGGYLKSSLPKWGELSGRLTPKDILLIPFKFILGRISLLPKSLYLLIGGVLTATYSVLVLLNIKTKKLIVIYLYLFIPFLAACLISLWSPMMGYWRFLYILPSFIILLTYGIAKLPKLLSLLMAGIVITTSLLSTAFFWYMPSFQREDWRSLAKSTIQDNSVIIVHFPFAFAPLKYYLPNQRYFFTQSKLGEIRSDLDISLEKEVKKYQYIYNLDYLSDLTSGSDIVLNSLIKIGLKPVDSRSFNGVGAITLFATSKSVLK